MDERRYFGLDALRGGMMMMGIVLHSAMFYVADPPPSMPMPIERNNSYGFDIMLTFIHSFRMPTFFVLAGFFTSLLVDKRGVRGTYHNRARRILAPLLAALVLILPVTALFMLDYMLSVKFGTHTVIPELEAIEQLSKDLAAKGVPLDKPSLAHLWFLYYLCYFYLLIPLCVFLVKQSLRFETGFRKLLASPLLLVGLSLYTSATLWTYRGGQVLDGFLFIEPHPPSLLYYGSFFIMGYVLHHHRDALLGLARNVAIFAVLVLIAFPLSTYMSILDNAVRGANPSLHLGAVLTNAVCTWMLICLFLGAATRFFDHDSPWIVYMSQSSYWVFLVHMPLVAAAAWWLVQFDLPSPLKFLIACSFTTVIAFTTFHYWVQKTWVSDFLHGRRFDLDWPWRAQASPQPRREAA